MKYKQEKMSGLDANVSEASHTPTPWQIAPNEIHVNGYFREVQKPNGFPTGILIESIDEKKSTPLMIELQKANAAFIVRAVNSFDEREAFLLAVSLGACLDQRVGDKCICYPCGANRLLEKSGGEGK